MRAVVNLVTPEHEHEFEATRGLPEALPAGETLLWQGSPDPLLMARQALHLNKLVVYFGALLAWRGLGGWYDNAGLGDTLIAMARMLALATLALGLIGTLGWLMARSTVYTITSRRVVMRIGVVLSITFNLPFAQIASASFRPRGNPQGQGGDIVLALAGSDRIAYLHLWPHARPWQLKRTQPMLRALAHARSVARTLAQALQQAEAARLAQARSQAQPQARGLPLRAVGRVEAPSGVPHLVSPPPSSSLPGRPQAA